jgi:hypothetical protein
MSCRIFALALWSALALAAPALADDSGYFVVRLGQDTTAIEHYTRTASRLTIEQTGRAPRVLQRRFTYDYQKGVLTKFSMVVTAPGSTAPTQTLETTFGDSARTKVQSGSAPAQNSAIALAPGTLSLALSSPWAPYETLIMKMVKEKRDSLRTDLFAFGNNTTWWLSLHRLGSDSVSISNGRMDQYHVRVDKQGRIVGVLPIAGTAKNSVERVASLDLAGLTANYAAREQAGAGMGILSPRDSVVTTAGGAALWIDYGRPGKRGRLIFGEVVPYGEVWRTGANAATQFRTDKALDFGGTVVPAGFYTLWTVPGKEGWKLRFNGETGQWGTAHKDDQDLYTVDMKVSSLPAVTERFTISVTPSDQGGTLNMDWDTTRASVAFTVKN